MKRIFILIVAFILFYNAPHLHAQPAFGLGEEPPMDESSPETKVMLRDGSIVIETPSGKNTLDYNQEENRYRPYQNLKKWRVSRQSDSVGQALEVFDKKQDFPNTHQRFLITNKDNESQQIYVEYSTFDDTQPLIFSPQENYVYYKTIDSLGESYVYGINLTTSDEFLIGESQDFSLTNCPDNNTAYIALLDDTGRGKTYTIYTLEGKEVNVLKQDIGLHNLEKYICY